MSYTYPPWLSQGKLAVKKLGPLGTVDGLEIQRSPVEVGSLPHYLQGFIHPSSCRISSINSILFCGLSNVSVFRSFSLQKKNPEEKISAAACGGHYQMDGTRHFQCVLKAENNAQKCFAGHKCEPDGFGFNSQGDGYCTSGQVYGSHAWELAPKSMGTQTFDSEEYKSWVKSAWLNCMAKDAGTRFVSVWIDAGYRCYNGAFCNPNGGSGTQSWSPENLPESIFEFVSPGSGHCRTGQIYASPAWELAPSSVGRKDFHSPEYRVWVETAWAKCLAKDAGTNSVSVWIDAGYRCYKGTSCNPNGGGGTMSWIPETLEASNFGFNNVGQGHCSSGQIYSSPAWELAPSSGGTKDFHSPEYRDWVKTAWAKCLTKDSGTRTVSVWIDAGYRCYKGASCNPNGGGGTMSWSADSLPEVTFEFVSPGSGYCRTGQIFASPAWDLAPKSVGKKGFNTPEYKDWVRTAWSKCLSRDDGTKAVSVWIDAGYRCYKGASCNPTGSSGTMSWVPESLEASFFDFTSVGKGRCASGHIYASRAWELAPKSVGKKGFSTPEYRDWVKTAWSKCLSKDSGTKSVSVWIDAGYRCYKGASCNPNGGGGTMSWARK